MDDDDGRQYMAISLNKYLTKLLRNQRIRKRKTQKWTHKYNEQIFGL